MKRFRERLRRARLTVLSVLFAVTFSSVDGHLFAEVVAMERREVARLEEISERLGVPVERLRRDNPSLVETLSNLVSGPEDRFQAEQLERLAAALERSQAEVDANPFRDRIEAVKLEHRTEKLEGVLRDLAQVSSVGALPLRPEARRALLRNVGSALREGLVLPPLPEGLPGKAETRHREMEDRLRRLARDVEPLLAKPEALSGERLALTVAELADVVGGAVARPGSPAPRFRETPLPVERVERQAPVTAAPGPGERASSPAVVSSVESRAAARTPRSARSAAGSPTPLGPIAAEITDLAASLGNSPARIFTWVHDNVAYDPKWGQVRSPLGTLLEKSGTSWDQAALLAELLTAAGVEARLEWGEIEIGKELLLELTGTANPTDAGGVLATGGVPIVLQQIASQIVTARLSHVWVKAHVDYIPNRGVTPGPPDTWIRMDPSLTRSTYQPGIAVHQSVPYALGDYLQSATALSPRRFRSEALWAYIRANGIECATLDQLKKAGSILKEGFPFLPGTLRGKIVSVGGEDPSVPAAFRHRVRVEVKNADGAGLLAWEEPWAELWGARTEIAWVGATPADEATIASYGSVFDTPPYLVDLVPTVRLNGVEAARGSAIGSARGTEVWVTLVETSGAATTLTHDTLAGEHHVLALDFGRLPQRLVDDHQVALAAALAAGDDFEAEAETLFLLGAQYLHNLGRDLDDLAGWNWQRLVKLGTEGLISQTGIVTATVGGTPLGFRRGERNVDVARMILGIFPADGDPQYRTTTFELLGSQSSYLEGEVFNQVLEREGIASVSALTRSKREGQTLTRVDSGNVGTVLAQVDLGAEAEQAVAFAVSQGRIAWVAETPIAVNQWTGTGYVLEDPATGAAGYLISGSLAGGSDTGAIVQELTDLLGSEPWFEGAFFGATVDFLRALLEGDSGPQEGIGDQSAGPASTRSDPINLSTGNFWLRDTDLSILTRGPSVLWSRTYNSRSARTGALGYGWTFSYGERLEELPDGSVLYREADGTEHIFGSDGVGGYTRPDGKHLTLTKDLSNYTLGTKFGSVSTFALDGRLLSIADPEGNTHTLGYDAGNNLASLTDAAGRVVLTVTTVGGRITQVADLTGRTVDYSYTGDDLTAVTDTVGEQWSYSYDAEHNLLSRSDPLGNTDSYAFDALDRCVRHTDPLGNEEAFAYSSIGRAAVLTDYRGFDTYLEFDDRGRAILDVDPLGNASSSTWDDDNNRTSTSDPRGGVTARTFDGSGNLLTETNPLDETVTRTYDPTFSQVLTLTDPSGHTVTNTYDSTGNLIERSQIVAGVTRTESYAYNAFGQLEEQRDGEDNPTSFTWDPVKGSLDSQTDALGRGTSITTDDLGRPVVVEDSSLNFLTIVWDGKDRLSSSADSYGTARSVEYDAAGRQIELTTPQGTSTLAYDAAGRATSLTDPAGNTVRTEYDAAGNITARIDAKGNRSTTSFDAIGRQIARVDPLGQVWTLGYCAEIAGPCATCSGGGGGVGGNFCDLTDPQGNVTRQEHDDLGRVVKVTDPLGRVTESIYDELGRVMAVRDPRAKLTQYEFDELDRLSAVVTADNDRTEYSYDGNGNLVNTRDAENRDWPRTYDPLNQPKTESDPLGNTTVFTYDDLGNPESVLTPNGDLITLDYVQRRLNTVNLPGGVTESFTYDTLGRLASMANSEVSLSYSYDLLNRLTSVVNNTLGQTLTYEYDPNGNLNRMTGPAGSVDYFYDAKNRLVEQHDPSVGVYRYSYDELDRRTELRYPNGLIMRYEYDPLGRAVSVLTEKPDGEIVEGYSYVYDAGGNPLSVATLHEGSTHEFEYDDSNRLTRWDRSAERFEQYSYDGVGNRLSLVDNLGTVTYAYDAADRLTGEVRDLDAGGSVTTDYAWDDNGNLLQKTAGAAITAYQWDPLNRLTQLTDGGGTYSYGYDPKGTRVRETSGASTLRFLHSFEDIVGTFDASNTIDTYFSHGPQLDEPLAQSSAGAETAYLHRDGLGSVTALSAPTGQLLGARSYSPFGVVETASGLGSRYGFTSRELDASGQMYYRARYYQPETGRFSGKDPFRGFPSSPQSLNRYTYAHNNPTRFVDPLGLNAGTLARAAPYIFRLVVFLEAMAVFAGVLAAFAAVIAEALVVLLLIVGVLLVVYVMLITISVIYYWDEYEVAKRAYAQSKKYQAPPYGGPGKEPPPKDPCLALLVKARSYSRADPRRYGLMILYWLCKGGDIDANPGTPV